MTWAVKAGSPNSSVTTGTLTQAQVTLGAAVAVGETIHLSAAYDLATSVTGIQVTDNLGNTYVSPANGTIRDLTNNEGVSQFIAIATVAGTPTITIQFLPTPGTTTSGGASLIGRIFTGSDAASALDGNGASAVVNAPGTTNNAISSGSQTTTVNGDLIIAATCDSATGNDNCTAGTVPAYTNGIATAFVTVHDEWLEQGTAGAIAGTFTTTNGSGVFPTVVIAVKPAAGAPSPTSDQEGARFGNDDGSESAHTFAAAQDANITAPIGARVLRVLINTTGDEPAAAFQLEYKKVTDVAWRKVT